MFESTLGTRKTTIVDLDLKDKAKPVCSRPYPVPKVHEVMFRKEVKRLVILGVIEEAKDPELEFPSFAQPKAKRNRVKFLSDFQNLNRQLTR